MWLFIYSKGGNVTQYKHSQGKAPSSIPIFKLTSLYINISKLKYKYSIIIGDALKNIHVFPSPFNNNNLTCLKKHIEILIYSTSPQESTNMSRLYYINKCSLRKRLVYKGDIYNAWGRLRIGIPLMVSTSSSDTGALNMQHILLERGGEIIIGDNLN